jgi:hypothetical protein
LWLLRRGRFAVRTLLLLRWSWFLSTWRGRGLRRRHWRWGNLLHERRLRKIRLLLDRLYDAGFFRLWSRNDLLKWLLRDWLVEDVQIEVIEIIKPIARAHHRRARRLFLLRGRSHRFTIKVLEICP